MPRYIVLIVFLLVDVWLILLILRRLKQKRMKTITALILSAVLVFEAAQVFPFLQAEKEVPLEYVCSVETTRNDPLNNTIKWYTDCSVIYSEPVEKEVLESCLECDLTDVDLDGEYTYLFVDYYKDVELFYSNWSKSAGKSGNVQSKYVIWLGRLEAKGAGSKNTIYIFRFPRKAIVPHDAQWL